MPTPQPPPPQVLAGGRRKGDSGAVMAWLSIGPVWTEGEGGGTGAASWLGGPTAPATEGRSAHRPPSAAGGQERVRHQRHSSGVRQRVLPRHSPRRTRPAPLFHHWKGRRSPPRGRGRSPFFPSVPPFSTSWPTAEHRAAAGARRCHRPPPLPLLRQRTPVQARRGGATAAVIHHEPKGAEGIAVGSRHTAHDWRPGVRVLRFLPMVRAAAGSGLDRRAGPGGGAAEGAGVGAPLPASGQLVR